jgi:hypothetical protein
MSHEWTMKFVQHRVGDPRIVRLIQKWLKAGVMEDGQWSQTKVGTPQGAVVSPLLANIYLHYVFDLWVEVWRRKVAKGDVIVVRYADDLVVGFESRAEAERFLNEFRERLAKFGLELHPEKTRLIEFGRYAAISRKRRGEGNRRRSPSSGSRITVDTDGKMGRSSSGAKRPRSGCFVQNGLLAGDDRDTLHDLFISWVCKPDLVLAGSDVIGARDREVRRGSEVFSVDEDARPARTDFGLQPAHLRCRTGKQGQDRKKQNSLSHRDYLPGT